MWWIGLLACTELPIEGAPPGDTGLPELDLPAVDDLPAVPEPPDPWVTWAGGTTVDADGWWSTRRPELQVLFHHYVYGWSAPVHPTTVEEIDRGPVAGGQRVQLRGEAAGRSFVVAVWLPEGPGPFPVILGLNKCGNPTVRDEPALVDGGGWVQGDCDPSPGSRASYWDVDAALQAGVGVATVHQSDFHPDDASRADGMLAWDLPRAGSDDRWGALGAWAWGLSRTLDALQTLDEVGPVTVFGHSRRGKTALWAAAQDPRFAGVWAHQSGTGGAALARLVEGETIGAVNALFPHWFDDVYPQFTDRETRLPIDQHLLLAMIAPRPLRVSDGDADAWANPAGARWSVEEATPVFRALGGPDPAWTTRPGGHEVNAADWATALAWLSESAR